MTEFTIGICDDLEEERVALARMVSAYAQNHGKKFRAQLFSSGAELLGTLTETEPLHILFLDIFMPRQSGIEVARQLRRAGMDTAIIFATTSTNHGLDGFEVQAADYLVKPFQQEDVDQALDWCLDHLPKTMRCLQVCTEREKREIPLSAITYIEVLGHQSHIHTTRQVLVTRRGLDALESELDSRDFLRCHRSFLVNMNYIQQIEDSDFQLTGGIKIPISTTNLARIRNAFIDWTYCKSWGNP